MSQLFVIATPIGNRRDITLRALQTLFTVDVLLCEDTRKTGQLLSHYRELFQEVPSKLLTEKNLSHQPVLMPFYEHNERERVTEVLNLLGDGKKVGLVTNAGTPTISDPGYHLVKACRDQSVSVVSIPGPTALAASLSISGLSADKVFFLGFLPKKMGKQKRIWEEIRKSNLDMTVICYESPYRVKKTLQGIFEAFGNISVSLARELTKIHEEVISAPLESWTGGTNSLLIKGEVVILFRYEHK